jgi:2-hydroxycyclohexanecarboxyl-CoA dehydrogenase
VSTGSTPRQRVALVTGAASGIGAACARMLRAEGFAVASLDRSAAEDVDLSLQLDVRDSQGVDDAFGKCEEELGAVDVLVTAAGYYERIPLLQLSPQDWEDIFAVLVGGTLNCCFSAARRMAKRRSGAICAIGSELALCGAPDSAHYATAKGVIHFATSALAKELRPLGVSISCVAPGPTDTPLMTPAMRDPGYIESLPLGRLVAPEEIAAAVKLALAAPHTLRGRIVSPNAGAVI